MIVLQATQDIRKVSLWLGHSNMATTEIYTRGDPSEKLEAIEAIVPHTCAKVPSEPRTSSSPCSGPNRNGERDRPKAVSLPRRSSTDSPLRNLPVRQVMGVAHYLRNRHCPKCQAAAAQEWLADRQAELLPVPYFHVVFTLPGPIADIAYQNRAGAYDLLLKTAAETLITIAADPKHLGARIGLTAVLHTWGSALTHHPHAHIIVPGGGFSPDGQHWIACRPGFFLSVRVLSRLFRRLFLERLAAYHAERLQFFADQTVLAEPAAFKA
jgi:hypothetical protein